MCSAIPPVDGSDARLEEGSFLLVGDPGQSPGCVSLASSPFRDEFRVSDPLCRSGRHPRLE
jgi:hypothetical protein